MKAVREPVMGQCQYCHGNLTNGHRCPLYYNQERKSIEPKFIKSPCTKCHSAVDKPNPNWLRVVRKNAGLGLRELGRKIGKSAPYISDVELGRRNCTEKMLKAYEQLKPNIPVPNSRE